jgi:hypothetical protein
VAMGCPLRPAPSRPPSPARWRPPRLLSMPCGCRTRRGAREPAHPSSTRLPDTSGGRAPIASDEVGGAREHGDRGQALRRCHRDDEVGGVGEHEQGPASRPIPRSAGAVAHSSRVAATAAGRWRCRVAASSGRGRTRAISPAFRATKWTTVPARVPRASSSASTAAATAVLPSSVAETPSRSTARRRPSPRASPPAPRSRSPPSTSNAGRGREVAAAGSRAPPPARARPTSASTNHATSTAPSSRERRPSSDTASSGGGRRRSRRAARGGSERIGAISAQVPATPVARKVVPPRKVPAAAPGSPFRFAAIPAARFSSSNPEMSTVRASGDTGRRSAEARMPPRRISAPATTTATPRASSPSETATPTGQPAAGAAGGG